jgi:hypothetical protein
VREMDAQYEDEAFGVLELSCLWSVESRARRGASVSSIRLYDSVHPSPLSVSPQPTCQRNADPSRISQFRASRPAPSRGT